MANADLMGMAVRGRDIATGHIVFGADPAESDAAMAFAANTLAEVILTIFQNPPATLTTAQRTALRTLLGAAGVTDDAIDSDDPSNESTTLAASRQAIAEAIEAIATGTDSPYYPVPEAGVGGTANAITLTTGSSLSAYTGGMLFFFNSIALNTGAVTVAVDGLAARPVQRSRYRVTSGGDANTGSEPLEGGEITANDPIMVVYGSQFNEFYLLPSRAGTAAYRNIGTAEHEVPALGSGGELPASVIPDPANDTVSPDALQADSAAQKLAMRTRLQTAIINATAAPSDVAETITVGGTTYSLPDDVEDVTDTGLPTLTAENYKQIFIDHDTPRVWVGHREIIAAVDAVGTFATYTNTNYRGVIPGTSPPSSLQEGQFYYSTRNHGWWRGVLTHGIVIGRQVSFATLFPTADWLGEQADDDVAAGLVDDFDTTRQYLFYSTSSGNVELLDNGSYVAATDRIEHFTAEPISSSGAVGAITGITAGAGLDGGGSSGQVSLAVDPTAADFPNIPINKGGTGAATAAAALAALGAVGLASPAFTGTPTAPTAAAGTNTTQLSTTAFVAAAVAAALLSGGADGVLMTAALQPDGITLRLTLSTGDNIDVNLNNLVAGLISGVATNEGLEGGGTAGDLTIGIADGGVLLAKLDIAGTPDPATTPRIGYNQVTQRLFWDAETFSFVATPGNQAFQVRTFSAGQDMNNAVIFQGGSPLVDTTNRKLTLYIPQLLSGTGAPADSLGRPGDKYVRTSNGAWYRKGTTTWSLLYTPPAGSGVAWQDEGNARAGVATVNLVGDGVTGSVDNGVLTVNIPGGAAPPTPTHTSYVGVSTDTTITEAEAMAGTSGVGNALEIPTFTAPNRHVFFARPTTQGAFTAVYLYANGSPNTQNQISAWVALASPLDIGGEDHNIIYSAAALDPAASGFVVEVV